MASTPPPAPDDPSGMTGAGMPGQPTPQAASRPPHRSLLRGILSRLLVLAVMLALLVGVLAAVRANPASTPASRKSAAAPSLAQTTSTQAPTSRGPSAPDFTLTTLHGGSFHLAAQLGHVVVLYFMATGCAGCEPGSHDLAQALLSVKQQGAQALAIDLNPGDGPADLEGFVQGVGIPASAPLQWGIDTTGVIANAYRVQALETTVVIDAHGQIAYRSDGPVPPAQLAQIVRNLV